MCFGVKVGVLKFYSAQNCPISSRNEPIKILVQYKVWILEYKYNSKQSVTRLKVKEHWEVSIKTKKGSACNKQSIMLVTTLKRK
jgi:hypothetical protein